MATSPPPTPSTSSPLSSPSKSSSHPSNRSSQHPVHPPPSLSSSPSKVILRRPNSNPASPLIKPNKDKRDPGKSSKLLGTKGPPPGPLGSLGSLKEPRLPSLCESPKEVLLHNLVETQVITPSKAACPNPPGFSVSGTTSGPSLKLPLAPAFSLPSSSSSSTSLSYPISIRTLRPSHVSPWALSQTELEEQLLISELEAQAKSPPPLTSAPPSETPSEAPPPAPTPVILPSHSPSFLNLRPGTTLLRSPPPDLVTTPPPSDPPTGNLLRWETLCSPQYHWSIPIG